MSEEVPIAWHRIGLKVDQIAFEQVTEIRILPG